MAKQIDQEAELLQKHLSPEEIFLLGFLKGFDRKITQEWEDRGLWEIDAELE